MVKQYLRNLKGIFVRPKPESNFSINSPLRRRLFVANEEWLRDTPRIWRQIRRSDSKAIVQRW